MTRIAAFVPFWWEFVIGDDCVTAAGVAAAIGIVAAPAGAGVTSRWVLPIAVAFLLYLSLRRATIA